MSFKLYEIAHDMQHVNELLDADEIDEQCAADAIEVIRTELEKKGGNIVALIRQLDGEAEMIDIEVKRLQAMKKSRENKVDHIKKYILQNLEVMGIDKVETPLGKISIRKSESVEISDITKLPADFVKTTIATTADKIALKAALKNGEIDGACIKTNSSIQVR